MSKVKYYYDSDTLSYKKIERRKRNTFKYASIFILGSALFGFLFVFLASQFIQSPKERALARELQHMELQYQLLNKKMDEAQAVLANVEQRDNAIYRLYFAANPIPEEQRKAGFGGINRYKALEGFDNSKIIIDANKRMDILLKQIVVQSKSLDEIAILAEDKEKFLASFLAGWGITIVLGLGLFLTIFFMIKDFIPYLVFFSLFFIIALGAVISFGRK